MASYGLYDIDLWHYIHSYPNLELMKIFNYHYNNGDMIRLMRPKEDEGRYSKIYCFKDFLKATVPKELVLTDPKKEIIGEGFYGNFYPLEDKYKDVKPNYLCYEPYLEKFKTSIFKIFKSSSYVRFENMDMSDYSKDKPKLVIADRDFVEKPDADYFLKTYLKDNFYCKHPIIFRNEAIFLKFYRFYPLSTKQYYIEFPITKEFLEEYWQPNFHINLNSQKDNRTENDILMSAAALIIFVKVKRNYYQMFFKSHQNKKLKLLEDWSRNTDNSKSFYSYCDGNKEMQSYIENAPTKLRFILKLAPNKLESSNIDLSKFL